MRGKWDYRAKIHKRIYFKRNPIENKRNIKKNPIFYRFLTQYVVFMTTKRRKWDYRAKLHKRIDFERNPIENKPNIKKKSKFFVFWLNTSYLLQIRVENEIIVQKYTKELILNAIRSKINEISKKIQFFRFFTFCVIFTTNKRRKWDYRAKIHKRIHSERNPIEIKKNI